MCGRFAIALGVVAMAGAPLGAQEVPDRTAAARDPVPVIGWSAPMATTPLPAALAPDPARPREAGIIQDSNEAAPWIGAIVGASVGLLASYWFVAVDCEENCSENLLLTSFVGVMLGGLLGYRLGGGAIPDEPPPPPLRWP